MGKCFPLEARPVQHYTFSVDALPPVALPSWKQSPQPLSPPSLPGPGHRLWSPSPERLALGLRCASLLPRVILVCVHCRWALQPLALDFKCEPRLSSCREGHVGRSGGGHWRWRRRFGGVAAAGPFAVSHTSFGGGAVRRPGWCARGPEHSLRPALHIRLSAPATGDEYSGLNTNCTNTARCARCQNSGSGHSSGTAAVIRIRPKFIWIAE